MDQDTGTGTGTPPNPQSTLNDPQSRRKFLRTAVIGAAGVAGGTAVAGAIIARQSPGLFNAQTALAGVSIHDGNCSVCLTGSNFVQVSKDGSGNYQITVKPNGTTGPGTPGTLFFWFTAPGLPGGSTAPGTTYDLSFTYDTTKFNQNPGNPFYRDVYSNGTAVSCPSKDPTTPLTGFISEENKSCVDGTGCIFPYTVPNGQTQDVQFHAHLVYGGSYPGLNVTKTYTFSFSLTTSGQTPPVCSGTITLDVTGVAQ
jgi:hypothetical protein